MLAQKLKDIHAKLWAMQQIAGGSSNKVLGDIESIICDLENIILADPAMIFPYDQTLDAIKASTFVVETHNNKPMKVEDYQVIIDVFKFRKEFLKDADKKVNITPRKQPWQLDIRTVEVLASAIKKKFPHLVTDIIREHESDPLIDFINALNVLP
jgi:hypothetical protein